MTVAVYLPAALSLLLVVVVRAAVRHTAPAAATRGVAVAAAAAALAYATCLALLALTLLDDLPPLSTMDDLGDLPRPVPGPVAAAAAALLAWGLWRLAGDVRLRRDTHRRLRAAGSPRAGGVVVADWDAPHAVAVPGRPGHVLVTTGLLRALDGRERRVVLAHERAHLRHRHDRLVGIAAAAAAVNPLLAPLRDTVAHQAERWADEEAAADVGDRALVARCVAKAALAAHRAPVLALGGTGVVERVRALGRPAPDGRATGLLGPHAVVLAMTAVTLVAAAEFAALAAAWLG